MGRLMPGHRGYVGEHLPPLELLEPLVDKSGDHWLWDGDFAEDDGLRFATFSWTPPAESKARFAVAKVLWSYANNESLHHRRFRNMCGLTTCVNPAHFERVGLEREQASTPMTLPDGLKLPDGLGASIVKLHRSVDTHILREDSGFTACYKRADVDYTAKPGTVITCAACLEEWREFDRPLLEVVVS